jgi:hypothetical protein
MLWHYCSVACAEEDFPAEDAVAALARYHREVDEMGTPVGESGESGESFPLPPREGIRMSSCIYRGGKDSRDSETHSEGPWGPPALVLYQQKGNTITEWET